MTIPSALRRLEKQGLKRVAGGKEGSEGTGFLTFYFPLMSTGLLGSSHPHRGVCICQAVFVCAAITELRSNGSKKGLDKFREGKSIVAVKLGGLDTTPGRESL